VAEFRVGRRRRPWCWCGDHLGSPGRALAPPPRPGRCASSLPGADGLVVFPPARTGGHAGRSATSYPGAPTGPHREPAGSRSTPREPRPPPRPARGQTPTTGRRASAPPAPVIAIRAGAATRPCPAPPRALRCAPTAAQLKRRSPPPAAVRARPSILVLSGRKRWVSRSRNAPPGAAPELGQRATSHGALWTTHCSPCSNRASPTEDRGRRRIRHPEPIRVSIAPATDDPHSRPRHRISQAALRTATGDGDDDRCREDDGGALIAGLDESSSLSSAIKARP
jgi:hypothetical protein